MEERYDWCLAAAYVRGMARMGKLDVPGALLDCPLDAISAEDAAELVALGLAAELRMYHFKRKEELPRVRKALGVLKSIAPETLLDVGSGRGAFLFPFLREFPGAKVTSLDLLPHRVEMLNALREGGVENLTALREDICTWSAPDASFDAVTLLEVLEHIPDVESAVRNAVRLARRCVVVSVPSKPDDNLEHIHLLTKDRLTELFAAAGCERLRFDGVNGHLLLVAQKAER